MDDLIFFASVLIGLLLIVAGMAFVSIPLSMIVTGAAILVLTFAWWVMR
jgi:hypothetical protein